MKNPAPPTVLVVEDERDLADLYAAWLSGDYEVQTAYSGRDGRELLHEDVDVVLLDRMMPGVSGDDVLAEIRERGLGCRVAMVTAVEPDFDVLELGFDAYLTKPASADQLHDVVERLLDRKQHDDAVQEFFQLVSKREALETRYGAEVESDERYQSLTEDIEAKAAELEAFLARLEDEDFLAQFHRLDSPGGPASEDVQEGD